MLTRCLSLAWIMAMSGMVHAQNSPRLDFRRMVAHWTDYAHPEYLDFLNEARPEVVQVGFYGGHFWSLAHTPQYKGYPAHFPVQGLDECGRWFEDLNRKIHGQKRKVVGHFNVEFLVGDPDSPQGPRGFFKFYRELWDEKLLGPRPVADPLELLQKNADGTPIVHNSYNIGGMKEYWGCLNNPHWRAVLKAWVKVGINRGVDGYVSNYFYRHNCLCSHCTSGFRAYLKERYSPAELERQFGIRDLDKHVFPEIVGWHNPKESTPLRREMLRFSQIATKQAFDDVFVQYGRSLKKDLIVAQWNHLGNFNQINGDERCLLPRELWGKDEDYAWYSTGAAASQTDFAKGDFGEGTLQARYIRGAFDNKPFTLGKYENTRLRVAIAELAANGGAPMGFYTPFRDPEARKEIVRYYNFLEKNDALYRGSRSQNEVLLLFPRSHVHKGDVEAVAAFRTRGKELLDRHVLFDILPDDHPVPKERYAFVLKATEPLPSLPPVTLSRFKAPVTVRVALDQTAAGDELVVHLVNYARQAGAPGRGKGIVDEKPQPVEALEVDLALPKGFGNAKAEWLTPESEPRRLDAEIKAGRLHARVPEFLVYGVIRLRK